jgi:hypothetical protein
LIWILNKMIYKICLILGKLVEWELLPWQKTSGENSIHMNSEIVFLKVL